LYPISKGLFRKVLSYFLGNNSVSLNTTLIEKTIQIMSIYVGNLSYEVNQEDLSEIFAEYGTVKRVHIPSDRETGRVRGFAFVEMESEANEDKAIEALDGAEWMDRQLKVNKAKPREDNRNSGGRRNNRF
jgi:RNA recognition motif-containing protein